MGTLSIPIDEAAERPKCSPGTSNTVSPFDISPVSNIKKRPLLVDAKKQDYYDPPLVDSDDDINLDINDGDKPDSREATCIFCDGKFSEDTHGKAWVKCVMCQMWAHLDCTGAETASYGCDFCK
ncbi:hypothetical protein AVEN_57326-1 [Araneus ventricosus]|uniref:Zinc finger PHD-type domain-containing protein n=1 Tax=Araneus ventricosus TaxID=182803 RepID=A0A4Y2IP56_ARAVE|nr:hypothetical protein AVEN_57326-1 [Araneus ventricosus]